MQGWVAVVSVEGRLKVTEELREQTGPGNPPQPPQRGESTAMVTNPQTRLDGHDRQVEPRSKKQGPLGGRVGGVRGAHVHHLTI